jgi:hypothetical protein
MVLVVQVDQHLFSHELFQLLHMVRADFLNHVLRTQHAVETDRFASDVVIVGFGVEETSNHLELVEHVFFFLKHPFIKLHSFLRSGLDAVLFFDDLFLQVLNVFLYGVKLLFEFELFEELGGSNLGKCLTVGKKVCVEFLCECEGALWQQIGVEVNCLRVLVAVFF